jgi:ABC-type uncharacterized transport system ATPase subunit
VLPERWLDGLAGARACAPPEDSSGTSRAKAARVELADVELAPRVLERAARDRALLDFRVHRPSLHDAFLALTGHAPRD